MFVGWGKKFLILGNASGDGRGMSGVFSYFMMEAISFWSCCIRGLVKVIFYLFT